MSRDFAILLHVSVLAPASVTAVVRVWRIHAAVCQTLYSDPTSLKLCHGGIKSCNDFQ